MPLIGIIGLFLIIFILILFSVFRSQKEGFQSEEVFNTMNPEPLQTNMFTISDSFSKYVNEFLESTGVDSVTANSDPIPGWQKQNEICSLASEPQFIPYRDPENPIGCGWWYNPDDFDLNIDSFSTLGSRNEPLDNKGLEMKHPEGKWFWNLEDAQRHESRKICSRMKICELADMMPGKCAFCPSLGYGVPVNSDGSSLYPNDADMACYEELVTNPLNCPRPTSDPAAEKGQKFIRLLCDPDPNTGKLHNHCLIKIAKALGFNEKGAVIKILMGDMDGYMNKVRGENSAKFRIATQFLQINENIIPNDSFFGTGICTRYDAMYYYNAVKKTMTKAANVDSKAAAKFLVNDTDAFDECKRCQNDPGPFELHCVQRAALENNIQRAANIFPLNNSDLNQFTNMKWGEIGAHFRQKADAINSEDLDTRRKAAWEIFGIALTPEEVDVVADYGQISGISYYIYEWLKNDRVSGSGVPKYTFFGRETANNFPEFDNTVNRKENQCKKIKTSQSQIRFTANLVSEEVAESKFWTYSDDGINIKVNEDSVLNKWSEQEKPTVFESSKFQINLAKFGPSKLEVNWFNNSAEYAFYLRYLHKGKFHPIPSNLLYQTQPTYFPICRWDFYEGKIEDRCNVLTSNVMGNIHITTISGKRCALFSGKSNYIRINNGISGCAFRTITMMVNLRQGAYGPFRFWEFSSSRNQKKVNVGTCGVSLLTTELVYAACSVAETSGLELAAMKNTLGPKILTNSKNSLKVNTWTHLAWVIAPDGMRLYMDGVLMATHNEPVANFETAIYENMYILHGLESYDKEIGVAWFRIFDYSMNPRQVAFDMENKFAMGLAHPTSKETGWA